MLQQLERCTPVALHARSLTGASACADGTPSRGFDPKDARDRSSELPGARNRSSYPTRVGAGLPPPHAAAGPGPAALQSSRVATRALHDNGLKTRDSVAGTRVACSVAVGTLRDGSLNMDDEMLADMDAVFVSMPLRGIHGAGVPEQVLRRRWWTCSRTPPFASSARRSGRDAVLEPAAQLDVVAEFNASPDPLHLSDAARSRGRANRDHRRALVADLVNIGMRRSGRRAWCEPSDLKVLPWRALRARRAP